MKQSWEWLLTQNGQPSLQIWSWIQEKKPHVSRNSVLILAQGDFKWRKGRGETGSQTGNSTCYISLGLSCDSREGGEGEER